ncbi:MAG TPA: metallophosphoesterase [Ktedonobacterales bacterium]
MPTRKEDAEGGAIGVVVTGDNHLSPPLPRLSPARRQARRAWLQRGFQAAVDCAIERDAALFINTGDLFDSPAPSNQDRVFVAEQLRRLRSAGIECIAISGNHDTPRMQTEHGGEAPQQVYAASKELRYFSATDVFEPETLIVRGLRIALVGLSNNPVAAPGSDPLAEATWRADSKRALKLADIAVLVTHAAIEGLARPNEGERMVRRATIDALPEECRVVLAGHIHRYAHQRMGKRDVVVVGATERMEFGSQAGQPGFVYLQLTRNGARGIEHIRTESQPRAEITLHTSKLWPTDITEDDSDTDPGHALDVIRAELDAACTSETLTRLRLTGSLTREQYHHLPLRDVLTYGQQRSFWLDVDTSGLTLVEQALALPTLGAYPEALTPAQMIALVVEEHRNRSEAAEDGAADSEEVREAGELLLARLRASGEEGA